MLRRFAKRINLNFKHSRSDRAATNSYRAYHHKIRRLFTNVIPFKKISQNAKTIDNNKQISKTQISK